MHSPYADTFNLGILSTGLKSKMTPHTWVSQLHYNGVCVDTHGVCDSAEFLEGHYTLVACVNKLKTCHASPASWLIKVCMDCVKEVLCLCLLGNLLCGGSKVHPVSKIMTPVNAVERKS